MHRQTKKTINNLNFIIMKYRNIELVKVEETETIIFESAIEKERFIRTHEKCEYEMNTFNSAELYKFICIDTIANGFVLNDNGLTYVACKTLINMYY